jgi:hypothetical protein
MAADKQTENQDAPKPKVYPQSPDRNSPGAKPPDLKAPKGTTDEEREEATKTRRKGQSS